MNKYNARTRTVKPFFPTAAFAFRPRIDVRTRTPSRPSCARLTPRLRRAGLLCLAGLALCLGSAAFGGQSISLSWNPSTTTNTAGYTLYRGTNSGSYPDRIDVGTNTTVTLAGLLEGQTNYFTVAAYNAARVEGTPSSPIAFIVPGVMSMLPRTGPGNPMQLKFPVAPGHSYDIQASVDLKTWSTISQTAVASSNAWVTFTDPQSSAFQKRFYRLILH